MLPEVWEKEIININEPVDWVEETSRQLVKDFELLGIDIAFKPFETDAYRDLYLQASEKVQHLFEKEHHRFLNLLYRIDMSEKDLHHLLNNSVPPELYDRITEYLLKREFMKVVMRYRYRI